VPFVNRIDTAEHLLGIRGVNILRLPSGRRRDGGRRRTRSLWWWRRRWRLRRCNTKTFGVLSMAHMTIQNCAEVDLIGRGGLGPES
jgi:hypothetical protein